MIGDLLAGLALLHREIPEEDFDLDTAVETVIETADREVSEEEREELDSLLPEWLESNDTVQTISGNQDQ